MNNLTVDIGSTEGEEIGNHRPYLVFIGILKQGRLHQAAHSI